MNRSTSTSRLATVLGLAVGATGCAILWVAGAVPFPIPPGMVIMAAGALLGLLFAGGALISPTGVANLLGAAGPTAALGQGIEVVGALTALIAGLIATSSGYRIHADAS